MLRSHQDAKDDDPLQARGRRQAAEFRAAVGRMDDDADIRAEDEELRELVASRNNTPRGTPVVGGSAAAAATVAAAAVAAPVPQSVQAVPLNYRPGQGGHRPNAATRRLLREAGGREALAKFTTLFYKKSFADPHIDRFIRSHDDPHGERMANWLAEKLGDGNPWTQERSTRRTCPFHAHGHRFQTPHDRSSAHYAAWHSPKREAHKFGRHFKLDDARVWMRLNFWALRESGIVASSPAFAEYYVKFIGHFVSVYERAATQFARESFRWSANPANIARYRANGNQMEGVVGVSVQTALRDLPDEERGDARGADWPYSYRA